MADICPVWKLKIGIFEDRVPRVMDRLPMHLHCLEKPNENPEVLQINLCK